jgi:hypothetical protein
MSGLGLNTYDVQKGKKRDYQLIHASHKNHQKSVKLLDSSAQRWP